jgi:hypothetical protein
VRRQVVIDESGRILASGPHPDDVERSDEDAPSYLGFVPQQGQQVHDVEFPDSTSDEQLQEILKTHRVRLEDGRAAIEASA